MKSFSIVAIVVFALSLLCIDAFQYSDPTSSAGWGYIACIFGIAYAITALVNAIKK